MEVMGYIRARGKRSRWMQGILLKGFRACYPKICLFGMLANLSCRHLQNNRSKKGTLTSPLLPESRR